MPTYEYECPKCDNTSLTRDTRPILCGECGEHMKRRYGFNTTNMPTQAGRRMPRVQKDSPERAPRR